MSDSAAPLTDAAPSSTADIAASVITEADAQDTSSEPRVDTTSAVEEKPKTEPTIAELSAAAKFLQKQGHKAKAIDGRDTWLKYTTVEKMLDSYMGEHRTTWDGERSTLSTKAQKAEELEGYINQLRAGVSGDPKAFLSELAEIDPRYAAFLEQRAAETQTTDDPMPQPDYDLGNGSSTYTLKGLQQRDAWLERQFERKLLSKVDERIKPMADREKAEQARAKEQQQQQALEDRTQHQLEDAATWPGWTDHRDDILKALQADSAEAQTTGARPKLTLEGAYRKVVVAKLLEDDGKKRERILADINAAPKSTALSRQTTDTGKRTAPLTTQEIARKTIATLESGS